jgi:polyribonucleotide nucleotidyltransferase
MTSSHQEIERLLTFRWDEVRRQKVGLKERVELWDARLKDVKRLAGAVPKESEQELAAEIEALECQHTTTSQTKAQERSLLYDIEKLKQKKKAASTYGKFSGEIEQLRSQLTIARNELLETEGALDELAAGLRKVRLAQRAGVNSSDLVEVSFNVDEEKIPVIVGKGGMNIRSIEGDHRVSIEIDHFRHSVRLTGLPSAIESAKAAIQTVMDTVTEDISISFETLTVLMMDKASRLLDLQNQYGVSIDCNPNKSACRITGLSKAVEIVKKSILSIQSSRADLKVEKSLIPSFIGKGGSNVRTIAAEHHVQINISRDDDMIEIVGLKNNVQEVVKKIKELIEDNREVEESLTVTKHVLLGGLLSELRNVQKEHNVRVDAEGAKEDKIHTIKIKGVNIRAKAAHAHVQQLIDQYKSESIDLEISDEVVPAVLGKGGAGIKALREKFPDSNIDLDGTVIHVHSVSGDVRKQITDEIHAIVGENYVETLECAEDFAIMLKTARAADVRDAFARDLNVRMNIEKNNLAVKLKGTQTNVSRALDTLRLLQKNYVLETIHVSDDDYPVLLKSGDESMVRSLSEEFQVDITANRKDLTFSIRGHPSNVQLVVKRITGFLQGDELCGSQVIALDDIVSPAFIGKGGAHIKKLEEDLGVKFDLLKSRGQLRIRGDMNKVGPAKLAVTKFLLNSRVNEILDFPGAMDKAKFDDVSRRLQDIFGAELELTGNPLRYNLRSTFQVFSDAKQHLNEVMSGQGIFSLPLLEKHVAVLNTLPDFGLGKFKSRFQVSLQDSSVQFAGDNIKLAASKRDCMRTLHAMFPGETAFIELSRACMRDIVTADLIVPFQRLGASIYCDRSLGFLWLVCPNVHLQAAQIAVEAVYTPWKKLNSSIQIDEFMVPVLVGKGGTAINALRKELDCSIEVDRTAQCIYVKGVSEESLAVAISAIQQKVDKLRAEHWETKMHPDLAPLLIGKQGSNINKFRAETGVNIDIDAKSGMVKLNGPEDKIPEAKRRLMEFIEIEEKFRTLPKSFHIPVAVVPVIIGTKGATIRELQDKSGAKIDLDRATKKCTLRGK